MGTYDAIMLFWFPHGTHRVSDAYFIAEVFSLHDLLDSLATFSKGQVQSVEKFSWFNLELYSSYHSPTPNAGEPASH